MRKTYGVVLTLAVLSLVFYFGSFTLANSETHVSVQTGSMRNVNATFNEGFCVYPDSPFGKMVATELKGRGHKVMTLSSPVECDGQFLAVWVEWFNVSYSPILAEGQVRVVAIYSSAGDPAHYLSYRNATDKEKALMAFSRTERPQFQAYILLDISDESRGIIGLRGYQNHLLREAVKATVDRIESLSHGEAG
ncbi:hypothetical protein [Thermococcus thioreducens]|uniref:Uncharacterized protein n=1 Tax=Thermococcus thioreducens TaxID=277988 RepID=A0A0Q2QSK0_9EURY|nr:hypothetical protein [Thermococcus thioreducens]ASJ12266.1 hypothetical protein A3L14_04900 [Thermococcus thioreducens]KQH83005.1 hypothetical protein AMR53_01895 [Thermococcus thioreducens]SEV93858.1 hypothetical protein SAMN05216170_0987 [Thermococcus thioreducens]